MRETQRRAIQNEDVKMLNTRSFRPDKDFWYRGPKIDPNLYVAPPYAPELIISIRLYSLVATQARTWLHFRKAVHLAITINLYFRRTPSSLVANVGGCVDAGGVRTLTMLSNHRM
jgi:hypothetical protein